MQTSTTTADTSLLHEDRLLIACKGLDTKEQAERVDAELAREREQALTEKEKWCGYTCGPQPRTCDWIDKRGCIKPEYRDQYEPRQ